MEETNPLSSTTGVNLPLPTELYEELKQIQAQHTGPGERPMGLAKLCIHFIRLGLRSEDEKALHQATVEDLETQLQAAEHQLARQEKKRKKKKAHPKSEKPSLGFKEILSLLVPILSTGLILYSQRKEGENQLEILLKALQRLAEHQPQASIPNEVSGPDTPPQVPQTTFIPDRII